VAVNAEFERPVSLEKRAKFWQNSPGLQLVDDPLTNRLPAPAERRRTGRLRTIGRLRLDCALENGLAFWISGDQLLKGAALNAVQIAELI